MDIDMYIKFRRGDSYPFLFQLQSENEEVITERLDQVFFSVKDYYEDEEVLFQKRLSNGTIFYDESNHCYYITINPEDTCNLEMERSYDFDIVLIKGNDKETIFGKMKLKKEVTFAKNEVYD